MKKAVLLIIISIRLTGLLYSVDTNPEYRTQVLAILEEGELIIDREENEIDELINLLYREKISIRIIRFIADNLPDTFMINEMDQLEDFLLSSTREMDRVMKKGMDLTRARLYFRAYLNAVKGDSQRNRKMLHSYEKENNENLDQQYRNRQINCYRKGKQGNSNNGNGNGNQHGGTGSQDPGENEGTGGQTHQHQHGNS